MFHESLSGEVKKGHRALLDYRLDNAHARCLLLTLVLVETPTESD